MEEIPRGRKDNHHVVHSFPSHLTIVMVKGVKRMRLQPADVAMARARNGPSRRACRVAGCGTQRPFRLYLAARHHPVCPGAAVLAVVYRPLDSACGTRLRHRRMRKGFDAREAGASWKRNVVLGRLAKENKENFAEPLFRGVAVWCWVPAWSSTAMCRYLPGGVRSGTLRHQNIAGRRGNPRIGAVWVQG